MCGCDSHVLMETWLSRKIRSNCWYYCVPRWFTVRWKKCCSQPIGNFSQHVPAARDSIEIARVQCQRHRRQATGGESGSGEPARISAPWFSHRLHWQQSRRIYAGWLSRLLADVPAPSLSRSTAPQRIRASAALIFTRILKLDETYIFFLFYLKKKNFVTCIQK